jgi:hypothetical protein
VYLNLFSKKYLFNPEKATPKNLAYTQIKKINSQAFNFLWNRFYAPALSWMNDNISSSFCIFMMIIIIWCAIIYVLCQNIHTRFDMYLSLRGVFVPAALSPSTFRMRMCCLMNTFIRLKSRKRCLICMLKGERRKIFQSIIKSDEVTLISTHSALLSVDWIIIFIQTHLMPNYLSHD